MLVQALIDALKDELGADVTLYTSMPATIQGDAVIIMPGDPFLTTSHFGEVEETWDILVTSKLISPDRGVNRSRELSLKVRKAAGKVGALWVSASPRYVTDDKAVWALVNVVRFNYEPNDILDA